VQKQSVVHQSLQRPCDGDALPSQGWRVYLSGVARTLTGVTSGGKYNAETARSSNLINNTSRPPTTVSTEAVDLCLWPSLSPPQTHCPNRKFHACTVTALRGRTAQRLPKLRPAPFLHLSPCLHPPHYHLTHSIEALQTLRRPSTQSKPHNRAILVEYSTLRG